MSRRRARTPPGCPCGGASYDTCCGRLHRGEVRAATAEQLMRSRYSAFAVDDRAWLLASWHSTTRPTSLPPDPGTRWTGLEVLATTGGGALATEGTVSFRARAVRDGRPEVLEERSLFRREGPDWRYVGPTDGR